MPLPFKLPHITTYVHCRTKQCKQPTMPLMKKRFHVLKNLRFSLHLLFLLAESKRSLENEMRDLGIYQMEHDLVLKYTFYQHSNHEFELTVKLQKYFTKEVPAVRQCYFSEKAVALNLLLSFLLPLKHKLFQACP